MTIATEAASVTLQGNNATKSFDYNFIIPYQADGVTPAVTVAIFINNVWLQLLSSEFTISGIGNSSGGSVAYPLGTGAPLTIGQFILIERSLAYTQPDTFDNQSFYPKEVENLGDELEMQIQQLYDSIQKIVNGNFPVFVNGREFYTSNYATPMLADAAAFAARGGLVVDSIFAFTDSENFKSEIVRFTSSALWVRTTHTITFDGVVFAPEDAQLFDAVATPIVFSPAQGELPARWFGVKADDFLHQYGNPVNPNATDDTLAWEGCFASARVSMSAPEVIVPRGVTKVSAPLALFAPFTVINGSNYALTGIKLTGKGLRSSVFQSYLMGGTMLTVGDTALEPSGGNNGYSLQHVGFSSAGTEDLLVDTNFCRAMSIDHCGFHGGHNRQLDIGRAQDYFITQNLFEGYFERDPVKGISVFGTTSAGITFTSDAAGNFAGPSFMNNNVIAHFRNAAHNAIAVRLAGGGGHRIYANEIGDADISLSDEVNGNSIVNNRFETSGAQLIAVAGGSNVGNGTVSYPKAPTGTTLTGTTLICGSPGYVFTFTGATTATVVDPKGVSRPNMTVGTPYVIDLATFLFTAGNIAWSNGDIETITATSDQVLVVNAGAGTYNLNRFSSDTLVNLRIMDFEVFGASQANDNFFTSNGSGAGTVVYFSANNNNEETQFQRNNGLDCRAQISDLGTSGKIFCKDNIEPVNTPGYAVLTALAAMPNIRNLVTADTNNAGGATSITTFIGGYNGQLLTLRIRDTNTTIIQGSGSAGITLLHGSTKTFTTGDILIFLAFTGTSSSGAPVWQQIAGTN